MQEIFGKIKKRFKEKRDKYENLADGSNFDGYYEEELKYFGMQEAYEEAIEIVNQVAEEYKNGHFGCNSNGQHEKCKDCGLRGECSHCNTEWFAEYSNSEIPNMSEKSTSSNHGWIPCSERTPEFEIYRHKSMWTTMTIHEQNYYFVRRVIWNGCDGRWEWDNGKEITSKYQIIAWKPLEIPKPYKPNGEK